MDFGLIKETVVNTPETWEGRCFITIDIEWCSEEVLQDTYELVEKANVPVTWFATHASKVLDKILENPVHDVGIHPNFNPLLQGNYRHGRNTGEVIDYYKKIVPNATSVRSHSMTQNTNILDEFIEAGLKFDCNHFVPQSSGIDLKPWGHWSGDLIKIPYAWEDDIHCLYCWPWELGGYLNNNSINVFNFHPIHIYLNTEDMDRYQKSKADHRDIKALGKWVNEEGVGTRKFLEDLLARAEI